MKFSLKGVIEVDVSEDVARARVLGRARGADDNNEVFNNRMKVYLDPIKPIRKFYSEKELLHVVMVSVASTKSWLTSKIY